MRLRMDSLTDGQWDMLISAVGHAVEHWRFDLDGVDERRWKRLHRALEFERLVQINRGDRKEARSHLDRWNGRQRRRENRRAKMEAAKEEGNRQRRAERSRAAAYWNCQDRQLFHEHEQFGGLE
jgi:hypothetical protein